MNNTNFGSNTILQKRGSELSNDETLRIDERTWLIHEVDIEERIKLQKIVEEEQLKLERLKIQRIEEE